MSACRQKIHVAGSSVVVRNVGTFVNDLFPKPYCMTACVHLLTGVQWGLSKCTKHPLPSALSKWSQDLHPSTPNEPKKTPALSSALSRCTQDPLPSVPNVLQTPSLQLFLWMYSEDPFLSAVNVLKIDPIPSCRWLAWDCIPEYYSILPFSSHIICFPWHDHVKIR